MAEATLFPRVGPDVSRWLTPKRSLKRLPTTFERAPTIEDVARWLLGPGRATSQAAELLHDLSARLVAAGLPLTRTTFHIGTLHPQFLGMFCRWDAATGETQEGAIAHGIRETDAYRRSPMPLVFAGETVRRRLDTPEATA